MIEDTVPVKLWYHAKTSGFSVCHWCADRATPATIILHLELLLPPLKTTHSNTFNGKETMNTNKDVAKYIGWSRV
jgi:hypothetical protein